MIDCDLLLYAAATKIWILGQVFVVLYVQWGSAAVVHLYR